ncbi:MAG: polyprenol monophosphomannose synthase [Candidatus Eiseniibacteriota bacterium]
MILIATYNERESIAALLARIVERAPDAHVLVVDDDSPDGTGGIVRGLSERDPRIHVLSRTEQRGYGLAVLDGFRWALREGAREVVTLDADLSHDPDAIPAMFAALDGGAQMVLGSRYAGGVRVLDWELRRLVLSVLANTYVRRMLRLPYADCTSGYRGYRREVLETLLQFNLTSRGYSFLLELLFWAHASGHRIVEVPIVFSERRRGQSKMSKAIMLESALRPFALWMKYLTLAVRGRRP